MLILKSKEFLRNILDHFQGFITVVSKDNHVIFANRALIQRTGFDPTGEVCYKVFHGLEEVCPECPRDTVLRGKKVVTQERKSPLDGRWYRIVNCPLLLPSNEEAMLAVVIDIHELRIAQKKAEKHRQMLELIFEKAPFMFLGVKPPEGHIVYVNPALKEILGYDPEEVKGRCVFELISPEELNKALQCCQSVCKGQTKRNQELHWLTKDGHKKLLQSTCFLVKTPDEGELVFTISRDITEIRRLEEQFLQAQKMEAVGRLAGGLAHDFNNLLTSLKSYLQLIDINKNNPEKISQIVSNMSNAIEKASTLTQHLLTFSRRHPKEQTLVELRKFFQEMEDFLRRLIGETIELRLILPPKCVYIQANEGHLQQIIMNLVVNAKDAMPKGGILEIAVDLKSPEELFSEKFLPPGKYAVISVSDTGVGIPPEFIPHIFDPFFTTKPTGEGTGLGLATVYSLVKQYQGHIFVSSEPGQGTVFTIYWPAILQEVTPSLETETPSLPQGHGTILFVEDEALVRQPVVELLKEIGYQVIEAKDGLEALEKVKKLKKVDLVISDLIMPRMDGYELSRQLKDLRPGLKILLCSGYPKNTLPQMDDENIYFLTKPYTFQSLVQKIKELLYKNPDKVH